MSPWLLPAAAGAFWGGLLVQAWLARLAPPLVLVGAGFVVLGFALRGLAHVGDGDGDDNRETSLPSLERAGLVAEPDPVSASIAPVTPRRSSHGSIEQPAVVRFVALVAALLLMGAGWAAFRLSGAEEGFLARLAPAHVVVEGSLRTDPKPSQFGWTAIVGIGRATSGTTEASLSESAWVEGDGNVPDAERGDSVELEGSVLRPEAGDFATYLMQRGIPVELKAESFERTGPSSNIVVRLATAARDGLRSSIQRLFDPREAGLLMGLALGDTSGLDIGVKRHFMATGLSHLLAVSGENVAMVLAPVLGLCLMLRFGPRARFISGLATVCFFVLLTGGEPSVLRAGVMAVIAMTGVLIGRPRSSWSVLGGAVLILLVVDPFLVSSIGFQLSVAATIGMVTLASPFAAKLAFLPKSLSMALGTSLAAQIGVAPVLLFYFHWIPGVTLIANLLAFPAVAPALLLGLAAAAAGTVFRPLGWVLAKLAMLPMRYLEILADRLASAPVFSITSHGGLPPLIGGIIVLIGFAWIVRGGNVPKIVILAGILLTPAFVWSTAFGSGPPSGLEIHFFDVGQGDGALISSPGGANVLVDGGPDEEEISTKLAALGVKRLDAVIGTHPHADHLDGLPEVFARFPVGTVLEPGCNEPSPSYTAFKESIDLEGLQVQHPRAGDELQIGDLTLDFFASGACFSDTHSDPNNDSLVFRLTYAGDSVLFSGDAEIESQQVMLDDRALLQSEVLKVPHHGGDTSIPAFFDAVHPQLAIVSVGQPNPYGHPVPKVLDELAATGARVIRTDQAGDVDVVFDKEGLLVDSEAA